MTEDEARTKWCPFARLGSTQSGLGSLNRDGQPDGIIHVGLLPKEVRCIASDCMAWRWIDTHVADPENPKGDLIRSTRTCGCCGLAGQWFANYQRHGAGGWL